MGTENSTQAITSASHPRITYNWDDYHFYTWNGQRLIITPEPRRIDTPPSDEVGFCQHSPGLVFADESTGDLYCQGIYKSQFTYNHIPLGNQTIKPGNIKSLKEVFLCKHKTHLFYYSDSREVTLYIDVRYGSN